jgi:hypothetical protein
VTSEGYAPIRGKCTFWRERAVEDDRFDTRLKKGDKRVECSCFVEGDQWVHTADEVPSDCPSARHCRYYIKHG